MVCPGVKFEAVHCLFFILLLGGGASTDNLWCSTEGCGYRFPDVRAGFARQQLQRRALHSIGLRMRFDPGTVLREPWQHLVLA